MYVTVNGCRLFVDIEGAKLVAEGAAMREKPTLVLLHGGPGMDHSMYKPAFSRLADSAQLIYVDHRGNGRSDDGPRDCWTLAQWGDDVKALCDTLGIERPIVLGTSFGGFVAQAYATRHPDHPARLILMNTAARLDFGSVVGTAGRLSGVAAWMTTGRFVTDPFELFGSDTFSSFSPILKTLWPAETPDESRRAVAKTSVLLQFSQPGGEYWQMDFRSDLARVRCPTLVIGGEDDTITPADQSAEIAAAIPDGLATLMRVPGAGHPVFRDDPGILGVIADWLTPS